MSRAPNRFVGLHSHSTFSTYDAIGRPQDHIDFAIKNGSDSLALTDHGNMNGFSHQYLHAKKLEAKGVKFKPIFGVEAYFIPSLEEWRELYQKQQAENAAAREAKAQAKNTKKGAAPAEELVEALDTAITEAKDAIDALQNADGDDSGGTIVENEEESKQKVRNPLYQRNHLVLLAKNDEGLKALFRLVSDSAADGFYRYPRMDLEMVRKYAKGNIVALSACIGGYPAKIIFDHQDGGDFKLWGPNDNNFELIQSKLAEAIKQFQDALGPENYYLELQFNKLGAQHLVNYHLIEASKRTGAPLVVTCDAHYADPTHWREREIYKMMGRLQFMKPEDQRDELPASVDELKCELYPKNAEQIWASYKEYCKEYSFYDDDVVADAIERTHDIAHQQIGKPEPDRRVKLPAIARILDEKGIEQAKEKLPEEEASDEDAIAFQAVKQFAIEGLKKRNVANKQSYIDRLKYELEVIKTLKFAKYFLTYYHIMRVCGEHMLLGNARGCFLPGTRVKMADGMMAPIETVRIGEQVVDAHGKVQTVENTLAYDCNEEVVELEFNDGKVIRCTKDHKFLTTNRGWVEAKDLTEEDDVKEV